MTGWIAPRRSPVRVRLAPSRDGSANRASRLRAVSRTLSVGRITRLEDAGGSRASLRLTQEDVVFRLPMTAASQSVTSLVSRGWARRTSALGRVLRRWERCLIVLAVCLPVPAFAATGLSIPLPATVERLAAALVPWADATNLEAAESLTVGADGAIVLARYELAETEQPKALAQTIAAGSRTATSGRNRPEKEGDTGEGTATSGGTRPEKGGGDTGGGTEPSGGSGGASPGSGGGDPGGSSSPVETIIEETGSATEPVVDAVEDTVDDPVGTVVGTVGDVVEGVGKSAGGLLPGAGP
jgi:hypothetical protein